MNRPPPSVRNFEAALSRAGASATGSLQATKMPPAGGRGGHARSTPGLLTWGVAPTPAHIHVGRPGREPALLLARPVGYHLDNIANHRRSAVQRKPIRVAVRRSAAHGRRGRTIINARLSEALSPIAVPRRGGPGGCAGGPSHSRPGPAPTRWHRPSAGQKPAAGVLSLNEKQAPIKPRN